MESIHGVLEWFIILAIISVGFVVDRVAPYKRARYPLYAVLLLIMFILDLNKASFRSNIVNAALYILVLVIIVEIVLICVRKKSKLLLGGALVLFVPVFLYVYSALLLIVPLPCHNNSGDVASVYESCDGKRYALVKRWTFDPFRPAWVYGLNKDIRHTPLKKQVDKYITPSGYLEAGFSQRWRCAGDGGRASVELIVDGYTLWVLQDKSEGEPPPPHP